MEVLEVTGKVLIVMAGYIAMDGLQSVLGGIIRGTGRQAVAVPIIFTCYYLIGLPTSLLLAFKFKLGVGFLPLPPSLSLSPCRRECECVRVPASKLRAMLDHAYHQACTMHGLSRLFC